MWRAQRHGEIRYSSNLKSGFEESLHTNGELGEVWKGMKIAILKEGIEESNVHPEMRKVYESPYNLPVEMRIIGPLH